MSSHIDILAVRRIMGRETWGVPEPFGPDGWKMVAHDRSASVIVTCSDQPDDDQQAMTEEWVHASIARYDETMPTYDDLVLLHRAVFGEAYAFQVFAPRAKHVSIHDYALHLWGRLDGSNPLPDFGRWGTI